MSEHGVIDVKKWLPFLVTAFLAIFMAISDKIKMNAVGCLVIVVAAIAAQLSVLVKAKNIWRDALLLAGRMVIATAAFSGFFVVLSVSPLFRVNPDMLFAYEMTYQKALLAIIIAILLEFLLNSGICRSGKK